MRLIDIDDYTIQRHSCLLVLQDGGSFESNQSRLQHLIEHLASLTRCILLLCVYNPMLFYAFVCTQHMRQL